MHLYILAALGVPRTRSLLILLIHLILLLHHPLPLRVSVQPGVLVVVCRINVHLLRNDLITLHGPLARGIPDPVLEDSKVLELVGGPAVSFTFGVENHFVTDYCCEEVVCS